MRRIPSLLLLALLACAPARPLPPATPPLPSTPPPPPEERERFVVTVTGTVRDARGQPVAHASVTSAPADPACTPVGTAIGAITDARGEFLTVLDAPIGTIYSGCVVVDATNGGAHGQSTVPSRFTSSKAEREHARVDVVLATPAPLEPEEAERLVRLLADAINEPHGASSELALYVLHGPEALRAALVHYRNALGRIVSIRESGDERHPAYRRISYELAGANGRTSRVDVHQEALTRIHSALLDYALRAEAFVSAYLRALAGGDAVRLSQILNPDDIDFPVERARAMILDYRRRYRDTATIQAELAGIDERRATIVWRLRGIGADGAERTEVLELVYGDGLIGVRGLPEPDP